MEDMTIKCEICGIKPISRSKGGKYKDQRGVFLVCKDCIELVEDNRNTDRRKE